jgi:hypothetical protein
VDIRRRHAVLLATVSVLLLAGCAEDPAAYPHGTEASGWAAGSVLRAALLWVGVPLAVAAVVYALVWLPGAMRSTRYRPQEGWDAEPVWFAGPADPVAAVQQAQTGDVVRGGAGGSW